MAQESATVVVGVDGSPCSIEAIRWAADEARTHHARLRAVHAWHYPATASHAGIPPAVSLDVDELKEAAEHILQASLEQAGVDGTGIEVERRVVQGPATAALVDAAQGARLLVVGARGLGSFVGLLLGHVSHQCSIVSPCPVAVVPAPRPDGSRSDAG
jgi:nucleotide-binding universal stress UspA family protein